MVSVCVFRVPFCVREKQPPPLEMRVRVADFFAQELDYCNIENRKIYHDLNAYKIFFDEEGDPSLSSLPTFGLIENLQEKFTF
ncbi:unnamed protein product [Arabidopsis lyrata]|uniref:Serine/threonine-protein kinase BSK n=1 Tax=Arabidopsis lyrata subsp. lyrata TaxID=81972 RepID=D7MCY3_ARALL|nr:hypothetical protein ARALYDRAFT_914898 [Arabidopsis lyrata subsp. lyrata]CAH8276225.1 unnamed protein product [Arabidopsis lyrata]